MNEHKKNIIKTIELISGKYAPYNIFSDWIQLCALAIQNNMSSRARNMQGTL